MKRKATTSVTPRNAARSRYGTPRSVSWATTPPGTEPTSIAAPPTACARPNTDSRCPVKPVAASASTSHASVAPEKNVKPRPSRIDASAQPTNGASVCHMYRYSSVESEQRGGAEQEREAPAARVGDDAGRDLEQHLAGREERVGREGLRVGQARIEQEQRVDAPDERRGECRQERQRQVDPLDRGRRLGHGRGSIRWCEGTGG